jgi:RNA polymerase sigma-70 factor (ECF subfamily)
MSGGTGAAAGAEAEHERDLRSIRLAADGDRRAFAELVLRHQASVLRLARALTRTPEAAEEVLQDTFLAALEHARSFRGESSVRTWLMTIARNAAARRRRRRAGEPADTVPLHELGEAAGWGDEPGPEAALEEAERRAAFQRALAALSEEDRAVIVLRDLEGLPGDDAAAVLGLTLPAMKTRLHRARLRLVAALDEGRDAAANGRGGTRHGP